MTRQVLSPALDNIERDLPYFPFSRLLCLSFPIEIGWLFYYGVELRLSSIILDDI